jgi:hypothetical protein
MFRRGLSSVLVVAGLAGAVACSKGTSSSLAAPSSSLSASTGNGAPKGKLVFNWNLIGTPHDYSGGCGDGHRIFVNRDISNAHITIQNAPDGWSIVDCNATGGNLAVMDSNDLGTFDVYARILGKPGGTLHVCADSVADAGQALCLLGTIDLKRDAGKSRFTLQPATLFDASVQDILWTVDTNPDFRIVQFRVYQTS